MKTVVSVILVGVTLFLSSISFPEFVIVDGFGNLILATLLVLAMTFLVALLSTVVLVFVSLFTQSVSPATVSELLLLLSILIGVAATDAVLSGFSVIGFLPKVLLAFGLSLVLAVMNKYFSMIKEEKEPTRQ